MCSQKALVLRRKRESVAEFQTNFAVSERRGCEILLLNRQSHRYRSKKKNQDHLRLRIKDIAAARVRYGYPRIYAMLRRDRWAYANQVKLDFSRLGKPIDNTFLESFAYFGPKWPLVPVQHGHLFRREGGHRFR
jgi:transposase InsO family protein